MKNLVLCGCGHGHIFVIKNIKEKYPDIKITVITDNEYQYYSGMYTGFLEGVYSHDEICFDVRKVCEKYGADLIFDKIIKIDDENKKVIAKNHTVDYDYLSINLGATQKTIGTGENIINSKPINTIIDLKEKIKYTDKNLLILGAGASGLELAFVLKTIYPDKNISILTRGSVNMEGFSEKANKKARKLLSKKGIKVYENKNVSSINEIDIDFDKLIMCIGSSGVNVDFGNINTTDKNFLISDEYMRISDKIFAVGDCVSIDKYPNLPKAGVYAIRQSPILMKNIAHTLNDQELESYVPDTDPMQILYCGNEKALLYYKGFTLYSHLSFVLKRYIDKKYMKY